MTVDGTLQATFAATLVDEWVRCGVTDAVVAPGSRSTPLLLALSSCAAIRLHVFLDERSAAFFALGVGMATGRPAVVVTTSGTAAVELHPAVVEASYARVPLLAVTADRPWELRDVGAPQTVDQSGLFGRAVRWFADPGVPDASSSSAWRSLAARAVAEAVRGRGPVHLNLPFRDPLVAVPGPLPPGRHDGAPWHGVAHPRSGTGSGAETAPLPVPEAARAVVVAGRGASELGDVVGWAAERGWPVLADPLSGCRVQAPNVIAAFDGLLRAGRFAAGVAPDVVVRVGAPPASKVLAQWLASLSCPQLAVSPPGTWPDPERTATDVLPALPGVDVDAVDAGWLARWRAADDAAQRAIDEVLAARAGLTEPAVARTVVDALPDGARLVVSSSMPVRDVEWFSRPRDGITVHANRGANGIDGIVSTALGVAAGSHDPTVALLGDLAFLHDSGGLLWARDRDVDCTFVVVDNDGGGIFSFLPQAAADAVAPATFERLFGTPHGIDVAELARAHALDVADDVAAAVRDAAGAGVRVVVVRTGDRRINVDVHAQLNDAITAAVA
ncbi:MAG TPA: 2-succinyl-5-enolpyruvyl-6-hydroxy-3-cyclohexene-1-carboxylic-acid synthase [Acidimicrobiales bacterium]|nr:2-succinyl-5-enolpyruvyl-6-hydroxy-3-cyclohexene-1-carboxylic-acid synthase [Acidimicrobiales bacterium]